MPFAAIARAAGPAPSAFCAAADSADGSSAL
jgi:hypothetical protein